MNVNFKSKVKTKIKPRTTVKVISGSYKKKEYVVNKILSNGYVILKNLQVLDSKKNPVPFKIHISNLKSK